jgi:hypothetical protein
VKAIYGCKGMFTPTGLFDVQHMTAKDKRGALLILAGLLQVAVTFGLLSGAAVVAFVGQVYLAGLLLLVALSVFLRFKRGQRAASKRADSEAFSAPTRR